MTVKHSKRDLARSEDAGRGKEEKETHHGARPGYRGALTSLAPPVVFTYADGKLFSERRQVIDVSPLFDSPCWTNTYGNNSAPFDP